MGAIGGVVGDADKSTLRKMSDSLKHRGNKVSAISDAEVGFFSRSTCEENWSGCLGEGNRLITFTGEMYSLERSLESAIERIGESLVSTGNADILELRDLLNGVYAFGFYDSRRKLLGLARDYSGYCPLYYCALKDRIFFASEIKSILAAFEDPIELDYDALGRFLAYGHCPGLRTLFAGIRRVPPSSVLLFNLKDHSANLSTYGTLDYTPELRFTERDFCRKIYEELRDAVVNQTNIGGSPYGIFLSGGVDSSFLAAVLKEVAQEDVIAYTAIFPEQEFNSPNARIVADSLGIEHEVVTVKPEDVIPVSEKVAYIFDDLIGNPSRLVPGFLLTEKARQKVKSIFTADGSDMLFFGSAAAIKKVRAIERMAKLPVNIRHTSSTILKRINLLLRRCIPQTVRVKPLVYLSDQLKFYKDVAEASLIDEANRRFEKMMKTFESNYFDVEEIPLLLRRNLEDPSRSLQREIQTYLSVQSPDKITEFYCAYESMIHTNDGGPSFNEKLSGHFGVPSRLPTRTNYELARLAASIPWRLKVPGLKPSQTKYIWRKTAQLYTSLPPKLVTSRHRGMSGNPIAQWLLSDLRDETESIIFDSLEGLHLDSKYIAKRLRKASGSEIKLLLMLSLWHKHYRRMLA